MTTIARPTTFRRRPFLLEPGDTLLLEPDPIRVMVNFGRFAEATGVPASSLVSSRLCALPVPVGHIRDWPQVRPELTFLPLLWLPPHLAEPKSYVVGDDGLAHAVTSGGPMTSGGPGGREVYVEPEEEWAVRVALELTASGFYDAESGTFLDVMDLVGIDVDTKAGRERVAAWLSGGRDDDLDLLATGLELEGHLKSVSEPDWALNEAIVSHEHLVHCAYAAGTESLAETLAELRDALSGGQVSLEEAKTLLGSVCLGAATWLEDLPLEDPAPEDLSPEDPAPGGTSLNDQGSDSTNDTDSANDTDSGVEPEELWWLTRGEAAGGFNGEPSRFVTDHLDPALERLREIHHVARPLADAYLAEAGQAEGEVDDPDQGA